MRIGFIGLGLMGLPMAKNIQKAGFSLTVWNRTLSKTEELEKLGAKIGRSPKDLALNSDVVITMVTGPEEVSEVIFESGGIVEGAKDGLVIIDMSTIGPTAAREISNKLSTISDKLSFLDAPVTGSTPKAISGELTIFVGGDKSVFERVKPVLEAMGKDILYIGESGAGQSIKLVNNLLVAITISALSEGFLLGDIQGLSRKNIAQNLENVPALSPFMKLKLQNYVQNEYKTLFSISNMDKDLKLALEEVKKSGKHLPLLELVSSLFDKGKKDPEISESDISAIIRVLEVLR